MSIKINKAKGHQIYRLKDGTRVPGVTTVKGVMGNRVLMIWANKIGLEGTEMSKYVDVLADMGTLTHARIHEELTGQKIIDWSEYSEKERERSDNSMLSYYEWRKHYEIEVIESEMELVSEEHRYGGTCDVYGRLDGSLELIDFKTGKGIYPDMMIQLVGYWLLLEENGYPVERARILNIPRAANERFDERVLETYQVEPYKELFLVCKKMYDLRKTCGIN